MKKILQLKSLLVAVLLLTCLAPAAKASHQQGADLTYICIAPDTYQVTLKFYRDCSGIPAANAYTLTTKSQGCNAGRTFTMNQVGNPRVGDPYCPQIPKTCSSTGRPNYEEHIYATTVTFSAAEKACTDWILAVTFTDGNRPATANVSGAPVMYTEAFLKLDNTINNNSPEFSPLNVPVPFVCWNQDISYSLNAAEPDGDSLVYKLVAPLQAANTPVTYLPINGGGTQGVILNPKDSTQFAIFPPGSGNFSPTYPIVSFNIDWSGPNPHYGKQYFDLNPVTGVLKFNPSVYKPGSSPGAGLNKYNVAIEITEWRKINGVATKVGVIRRDMLFIVEDCGGNKLPVSTTPPAKPIYNAQFKNDTVLNVQTCNTTPIRFVYSDTNPTDQLKVTFGTPTPAIPNSQGPTISNNNTNFVTALLYVTPEPGDEGKDYYLPVVIEDNSCPIKGIVNQVYRIHVVKQDLALIIGDTVQTICLGESAKLDVFVNRPDSAMATPVQATTKLDTVHYTYEWTPAPGLNNADLTNKIVTVTPIVTTRYYVKINGITGCFDTTSVLVKVDENPIIKSIKVGYGLMGGQKAGDDQIRFGSYAPINVEMGNANTTGYTYSWTPSTAMYKDLAGMKAGIIDSTVMNPIVGPLKTTVYTLTVTNSSGQCVSEEKVTANVGPFFLPNIITPNNDGNNDFFEFRGIEPNTLVQIYNRWGVLVKEYKSYNNEFDGKDVADGTYYYLVKEPNGKSYKGWFEIVH